jgi:hypothetical protein
LSDNCDYVAGIAGNGASHHISNVVVSLDHGQKARHQAE